jgi:hypothetical protein
MPGTLGRNGPPSREANLLVSPPRPSDDVRQVRAKLRESGQLPQIEATSAHEWRTQFRLVSLKFRERGNRLARARFRHQGGEQMTQGALSSLPPSFSPRGGLADEVHRAAYLMQGRIPQIRRALAVVRQQVLASDAQIKPTKDAWLGAVQDAMTGPPLDVQAPLFKRVLGDWIARDLFGLDDPTKMPRGESE